MTQHSKSIKESQSVVLFENQGVRRIWDKATETWRFAVVDVVRLLSGSKNPSVYWRVLKNRLSKEGGKETVTNCNGLKMRAPDGKMRLTDVADTETILRIVQAIPSPNAEPVKRWLAWVGYERIEETKDPEKAIHRAIGTYAARGFDDEWIGRRLKSIKVRNELTREWKKRGIRGAIDFAILTNDVYIAWAGMTSREYKDFKKLTDENLRDHMSELELVLNMLAESATAEITRSTDAQGVSENRTAANKGGSVAGTARKNIENTTKKPIITPKNNLPKPSDSKRLKQ